MSEIVVRLSEEDRRAIVQDLADLIEQRMATSTQPEWLDVDAAAAYMGCKPQRIYDLTHQKKLRPARDGTRLRFRRQQLDEYLTGRDGEATRGDPALHESLGED